MSHTIWFTGLSGAGKTTLSKAVYLEVRRRGFKAEWLDGDLIRANFSQELGFTKKDRDINVRRLGFVSHLLNKNDVFSIVAAIAPYAEARQQNRSLIGNYIQVYVDCPLEVVVERDVKGLYKRAMAGEIPHFTGVSDPYEPPAHSEIVAHTDTEDISASIHKVLSYLESNNILPPVEKCRHCEFGEEEEIAWRDRLASMGYAKR